MFNFYYYPSRLQAAGLMNEGSLNISAIKRKKDELTCLLKAVDEYKQLVDMPLNLLLTINTEIQRRINSGYTPLEAIYTVADAGIGLELVLIAQSLQQNERYDFEKYILNSIVLILDKLGLKPRQIMNIIDKSTGDHYEQTTIKNIITGIKENKGFIFFKDNLQNLIDDLSGNPENQIVLTNLLKRPKQ